MSTCFRYATLFSEQVINDRILLERSVLEKNKRVPLCMHIITIMFSSRGFEKHFIHGRDTLHAIM